MRKNWLTTFSAAVCAAGVAVGSAQANPATMALPSHWLSKSADKAQAPPPPTNLGIRPSEHVSPVRNPVKYMKATVAEMPFGSKSRAAANPMVPAGPVHKDSISLDAPAVPPTPELIISVAQMCERQGNVPQARQHYQRALRQWPGNVEVLRAAARMEDRQGQLPVAENLYRLAVTSNPQHAGALNDLGLCLARQGKLEPSIQAIEQAIQLQPEKPLYRNNAATVLVEMRQDQVALSHLAAVHGSAEANYNLGQLLVQRGRGREAEPYFLTAMEQNPGMAPASAALAKLQGADGAAVFSAEPGTTTTPAALAEGVPGVASQPAPTESSPGGAPQQVSPVGPQFGYPATARSPEFGASSYVLPGYNRPAGVYPPSNYRPAVDPRYAAPRSNAGPRYLPPVANQPGNTIRR